MGRAEIIISAGMVLGLSTTGSTSYQTRTTERFTNSVLEQWSDLELISAVVSRHDGAFSELFRRHYRSIASTSRMVLSSASQSEDIAADVLFEFWLDPEKFDPTRGTLLSFLRLQAKGRSIDLIRTESARSRRERFDTGRQPTFEPGVDLQVLSTESLTHLRGALAQLPHDEREPIELAFFGGLSYIAVAQHLGIAEGTVKSRIRCGLARLRLMCLTQGIARAQRTDLDAVGSALKGDFSGQRNEHEPINEFDLRTG
jgi:RNA polymerase sigma factor (sigma-70 family)